jgi:pyridoxamine 5'-phosphate oxidase
MNTQELMREIGRIVDAVGTAVFATVDAEGKPDLRWVTPVILRGRAGAVYFVTYPGSGKVSHVSENPHASWMFQTRSLDTIVTAEGKVNVLDNPSIRNEVLETVGPKLHAFWKINRDERDLLVLETILTRAVYYIPMKGKRETVDF